MTSSTKIPLSLSVLRRYHFGELAPSEAAQVKEALEKDEQAAARLAQIQAEEKLFLERVDLNTESVAVIERLHQSPPSLLDRIRKLLVGRTFQAATAAVLLVVLIPVGLWWTPNPKGPNRTKGSVQLEMFVKGQSGVQPGIDGMTLQEGDQVQFRYQAVGRNYLFVVSVDDDGVVSPLFPDSPSQSIAVRSDGKRVLDGSIILDDAVGPERFFAVFSDRPISFEDIKKAVGRSAADQPDLKALQRLDFNPQDIDQASILIVKE